MNIDRKETRLDVRQVEPKHRLDTIMGAWNSLSVGDILFLNVDHDPLCMYYTLKEDYGDDSFTFDYITSGPIDWEVKVIRRR